MLAAHSGNYSSSSTMAATAVNTDECRQATAAPAAAAAATAANTDECGQAMVAPAAAATVANTNEGRQEGQM